MKRFQLMQRVNVEGLYGTIQASLPYLKQSVSIDTTATNTTNTASDTSSPRPLLDNDSTQEKHGETAKAQRLRGSGRVIVVSPPIYSRFFRGKTAYAMGKVGMSVLTKGLAMDFERQGVADRMAITSIWPAVVSCLCPPPRSLPPSLSSGRFLQGWGRYYEINFYANQDRHVSLVLNQKAIESAATRSMQLSNPDEARDLRKSTIFSDAILAMLRCPAATVNGRLELDEDFLRSPEGGGVTDFDKYALIPRPRNVNRNDWEPPRRIMPKVLPDLSVAEQDDQGKRMNSAAKVKQKAKL